MMSFSPAVSHATVGTPSAIVTADFNKDGKLDLATCANAGEGSISVLLGNGDGGFGAVQRTVIGSQLSSMAVADFNSDGKLDIVAADTAYSALHLLKGNGDGSFLPAVTREQWAYVSEVAAGDFNNDGKSDLLVRLWEWENPNDIFQVQLGDGKGGFWDSNQAPFTEEVNYPYAVTGQIMGTADLNHDGKLDMVTAHVGAYLGNGNGALQSGPYVPVPGRAVAAGDFTGDGNLDVVAAGAGVQLLPGKGDGGFNAPISHSANGTTQSAVAPADFNADGKLDAIVTDSDIGTASVLLGNGDGTLRYFGAYATGTSPSGVVVGDFNRDGRPDVAVSNSGYDSRSVSVLLNDGDWATKTFVGPGGAGSGGNWSDAGNWNPSGVPVASDSASIAGKSVNLPSSVSVAGLTLTGGAALNLGASGNRVFRTTALGINGSGSKLNLADNAMIIDYGGASPVGTIGGYLQSGLAAGAWNGSGINSSSAAATPGTALGFAEASDLYSSFPATFAGQNVDGTSVLVRFTLTGDADLNRTIDTIDFNLLAANFGRTGKRWSHGDFNYDQSVDTVDFNLLASKFGQMQAAPEAGSSAAATTASPAATSPKLAPRNADPEIGAFNFSDSTVIAGSDVSIADDDLSGLLN